MNDLLPLWSRLTGAETLLPVMKNGARCCDDFMECQLLIGGFDWRRDLWRGVQHRYGAEWQQSERENSFKVWQLIFDGLREDVTGCDWLGLGGETTCELKGQNSERCDMQTLQTELNHFSISFYKIKVLWTVKKELNRTYQLCNYFHFYWK